jgi:hypothetical protein
MTFRTGADDELDRGVYTRVLCVLAGCLHSHGPPPAAAA